MTAFPGGSVMITVKAAFSSLTPPTPPADDGNTLRELFEEASR
jgi:hypothetical protein